MVFFFKEDKGTQRDTEKSSKRTELEGIERDRKKDQNLEQNRDWQQETEETAKGTESERDQTQSEKLTEKEKQIDPDKQTERDWGKGKEAWDYWTIQGSYFKKCWEKQKGSTLSLTKPQPSSSRKGWACSRALTTSLYCWVVGYLFGATGRIFFSLRSPRSSS